MTISKATARATLVGHDGRLTNVQVDQAVLMLTMLAEPARLRQHLSKLRMVGLVQQRVDGRARLYRPSDTARPFLGRLQ